MSNTLGEVLDINSCNENELYKTMDWLLKKQTRIEQNLADKHLENGSLILYDLTSVYYTGDHCSLAKFGHSKDRKDFPQIVFGLITNDQGCPIAVEVFEGNVGESKTLKSQIEKIRMRFGLSRVVLVGDRGIMTQARIREDISTVEGLDWITALRAPEIRALVEQGNLELSLFDERDMGEITSPEYPGERLIVCRNPFLAQERTLRREDLLKTTEKSLDKIVEATQRKVRPLKGKEKIGLRVGSVLNKCKVGKHFKLNIGEEHFSYERDTAKINTEAAVDGIYILRTNLPQEKMNSADTVRAYKNLSVVEQAFRSLKTTDLKVRPIYHRLSGRVRAHIFLCMLAYYVEWHMRQKLAPALFDEESPQEAESLRSSVVAPAVRSPKTLDKVFSRRTEDGMPVHSFRTMLKDLATITRNRVKLPSRPSTTSQPAEFNQIVPLTPLQNKIFKLLGVPCT